MRTIIYLLLFLLFGFSSIQCSKKQTDTIQPTISLITPKHNDTIHVLQGEIPIEFSISDNESLEDLEMNIYDSVPTLVAQQKISIGGTNFHYSSSLTYKSSSQKMKLYHLEIKAKDKSGNIQSSKTNFIVTSSN